MILVKKIDLKTKGEGKGETFPIITKILMPQC